MEAWIIAGIIGILAGIVIGLSAGREQYWKGRLEGWSACEQMIMERAKADQTIDHEEIWNKLVR